MIDIHLSWKAIAMIVAIAAAAALIIDCSRKNDLTQSNQTPETQDACIKRVQQQYMNTSVKGPTQETDALESAILLCKF